MTFDYQALLTATGHDHELAKELLLTLIDQIPAMETEIEGAIASKDPAKLRMAAHSLRGPLSTIGAQIALGLAIRIEVLAMKGDLGCAVEAAQELIPALKGLLNDVKGHPVTEPV